jgi:hypothetical protein
MGSPEDADFWLLLQSSFLQLASMVPVVFSLPGRSGTVSQQPRFWSWFFLGSGVGCSILSPIIYLTVPKEVSGVVSCAGGIAQAFIILHAMFLVDKVVREGSAKAKTG